MPIIHISGASGSGKSTLGQKLSTYFTVFDLDRILFDFVKQCEESKESAKSIFENWIYRYQTHLNNLISQQTQDPKKVLIFVGLNTSIGSINFRKSTFTPPKHFYDLHATHKFYIDLTTEIL